MAPAKLISSLKISIFSILLFFSCQASADYMVDYGPGPNTCYSCAQPCNRCHREYYHRAHRVHPYYRHYSHHIRRHGTYTLEIIYTTTPYPDYYYDLSNRCQTCHYRQRCVVRQVNYATVPVREISTCQGCQSCTQGISYDRSTADDTTDYY